MADLAQKIAAEIAVFVTPLKDAAQSVDALTAYILRFGYDVAPATLGGAVSDLGPLAAATQALVAEVEGAGGPDGIDVSVVLGFASQALGAIDAFDSAFQNVQDMVAGPDPAAALQLLPEDVFASLLTDYLRAREPIALSILGLAGVHRQTTIDDAASPRWRGAPYTYSRYDWAKIGQLFSTPGDWAQEVYGWGVDFDSDRALFRLETMMAAITSLTRLEAMTDAQIAAFLPRADADGVSPRMIVAPLATEAGAGALAELGLALFPASGANAADRGLAAGPYAIGQLAGSSTPFPGVELRVTGDVGALGGAIFQLRPSGLTAEVGPGAAALAADFGVEVIRTPETGDRITLIGQDGGTRIEAMQVSAKVGGSVQNSGPQRITGFDAYAAAGVTQLTMVIDPGDDGLLSSVLSGPVEISAGDIGIGWRPEKGIYFEGGSNLGLVIPIERSFGPLHVRDIGLSLDFEAPATLTLTTSADLSIGPLFASADNIGVAASLVPAPGNDGLLGRHDLDFGFVPPTGYAVALDGGAVTGGGLLAVDDAEYRGALALKFQTFGFSAFAILNTELPGGEDGFSFAASIFSEFSVPLPFGFFLTGVGGMIGINRTIDTDALRETLYAGRLDNILFPDDPTANAATILSDMAAIMPPREGQHIFGPVVKIGWGQPVLIEAKLGLVLEVGRTVRIVILGGLGMALPTRETAIVEINLTFFGEIDVSAGTIGFDATLANSRILTYTISGDAAIRTGWAPRLEHVASFGGLHPEFPRPSNLPDLRALTLAFGTNNPRVTVSAYSATTTNSLQFGGRADLYARGPDLWLIGQLAAEGWVYLDALVYFDPFAFDAALGGGLRLLRNGRSVMSLGFDLRLRGPNTFQISGNVWARVLGKKVNFGINHRWGAAQTLPTPSADPVALLREAVRRAALAPVAPTARAAGATFAPLQEGEAAIDPLGGASFSQSAAPLDVRIVKIGEAEIAGGPARLSLKVFDNAGRPVDTTPVRASFVHGHFHRLTEAERLRATAFDSEVSGFQIADADMVAPEAGRLELGYEYEYVEIPIETVDPPKTRGALGIGDRTVRDLVQRFNARELEAKINPDRVRVRPELSEFAPKLQGDVFVQETGFGAVGDLFAGGGQGGVGLPVDEIRDTILDRDLARASFAGAREALAPVDELILTGARREANPVVTDYVLAAGRI